MSLRTSPTQLRAIGVAGLIVAAPMADMGAASLASQHHDALTSQTEESAAAGDPTPLCPAAVQSTLVVSDTPSRLKPTAGPQPSPRPALSVAPKQSPPA